jgi:uncharacterized HAD superfamily protein
MQIIIDLDGTVCSEERTFERALACPHEGAMEAVNRLFDAGHTVIIYSARGWGEYRMTKDWLDRHGFKYHSLVLGKPVGDVWIDDRAIRFKTWPQTLQDLEALRAGKS